MGLRERGIEAGRREQGEEQGLDTCDPTKADAIPGCAG